MAIAEAILVGFGAAVAAPGVNRIARGFAGWILALLPLGLTVYFALWIGPVAAGESFRVTYPWVPTLGVNLSFYLDGLALLFALLISGVGAIVVAYAGAYLAGHHQLGRFYAYLLAFMASMLGLVLADNVITLFVFWELTSFTSYLLIGFAHEQERARGAALQALLVTGLGGIALLAGLLLLGNVTGSLEISAMVGKAGEVQGSGLYLPILLLVFLGTFAKSAQFPFHFWLPAAMEAPTPVSAYLHSATMVKAGVYLLARLSPVLSGTGMWAAGLVACGAVTMLWGAFVAYHKRDLKQILAYSTVSALGTLVVLLGLGTPVAVQAAVVFLLAHALYKGALFLVAGAVDHETRVRDVEKVAGLRRVMPLTCAAAGLAALSMAGLPPFFGFIAKELLYDAQLQAPILGELMIAVGVLTNIFLVAVAGVVFLRPFFARAAKMPGDLHEAPLALWIGPLVLGGLGLAISALPGNASAALLTSAASAVSGHSVQVELSFWHGLNPVVLLSALTLACGGALYVFRGLVRKTLSPVDQALSETPERVYEACLAGVNWIAARQTRLLQSGYLRYYIMTILLAVVALTGYALLAHGEFGHFDPGPEAQAHELAVAAVILLGALAAVRSASRLAAVASLGVVGFGVALLYVLFGAPDLAMTQFLVETITVIVLVLVFYHLPRFAVLSTARARMRDAAIAIAVGGLMSMLVLAATSTPEPRHVSAFYAQTSVAAHGRNVVNVILVDFRALDTLGEITVLAVAGIGVYALLKLRSKGEQPCAR